MSKREIRIKANKDNEVAVIYKDGMGNPIDISGWSARLVAREGFYKPVLIDVPGTITGGEGKILFSIPKASVSGVLEAQQLAEMLLVVDAELTKPDGKVIDLFYDTKLKLVQSAAR